jgi:hypothetical protein
MLMNTHRYGQGSVQPVVGVQQMPCWHAAGSGTVGSASAELTRARSAAKVVKRIVLARMCWGLLEAGIITMQEC